MSVPALLIVILIVLVLGTCAALSAIGSLKALLRAQHRELVDLFLDGPSPHASHLRRIDRDLSIIAEEAAEMRERRRIAEVAEMVRSAGP